MTTQYNLTAVCASNSHTILAEQLNAAMESTSAQVAYLAVWGVEWSPLPLFGNSTAESTTLATRR